MSESVVAVYNNAREKLLEVSKSTYKDKDSRMIVAYADYYHAAEAYIAALKHVAGKIMG